MKYNTKYIITEEFSLEYDRCFFCSFKIDKVIFYLMNLD